MKFLVDNEEPLVDDAASEFDVIAPIYVGGVPRGFVKPTDALVCIVRSRLPTEGWNARPILSDVHGLSVCLSVSESVSLSVFGHTDVLWQNGWTDRDAIWHVWWSGSQ